LSSTRLFYALFIAILYAIPASAQSSTGYLTVVDVTNPMFGTGTCTGSDDSAAIQAALTYAASLSTYSVTLIPQGYTCNLKTASVEAKTSVEVEGTLQYTQPYYLYFGDPNYIVTDAKLFGHGQIQASGSAYGVFIRNFAHFLVQDLDILNGVTGIGCGDSSITARSSYECYVSHANIKNTGSAIPSSVGISIINSTDAMTDHNVVVGYVTGWYSATSQNNSDHDHIWGTPTAPTATCFRSAGGNGNFYTDDVFDGCPVGLQTNSYGDYLKGIKVYNGSLNTMTAVVNNTNSYPGTIIHGMIISGSGPYTVIWAGSSTAVMTSGIICNIASQTPCNLPVMNRNSVAATTSGSFYPQQDGGPLRTVTLYLSNYLNSTATAQTQTIWLPFIHTAGIRTITGSCAGVTTTTTTITLPANMSSSIYGVCAIEGN
jgi:hypothetical protein